MKYEIRNRYTSAVHVTAEIDCVDDAPTGIKLGLAVRWAFKSGANLSRADLSGANLSRADLSGADLSGADLSGAYLSGANLSSADLSSADLSGADLSGADLSGADLSSADLSSADLSSADLSGANLSGADLSDQWIVQGATRSDGYAFFLTNLTGEGVRVRAGCRNFSIIEATAHWKATRDGTPLGNESYEIINNLVALAFYRGLIDEKMEPVVR